MQVFVALTQIKLLVDSSVQSVQLEWKSSHSFIACVTFLYSLGLQAF